MSKIIINGKEYNSSSGIIDTEFTSNDTTNPTEYTDIDKLSSGESIKSILNKISTMFKNIRYLYKLLGNTDISSISNGTITGAIKSIDEQIIILQKEIFPSIFNLYKNGTIGAYGIRDSIYKTENVTAITRNSTNIKMTIYWKTGIKGDGALISTSITNNYKRFDTVHLKATTDGNCSVRIAFCPTLPNVGSSSSLPSNATIIQTFSEANIDADVSFNFPNEEGYIIVNITGKEINGSTTAYIYELSVDKTQ